MKIPKLHNYELVKNTMLNYNESFLRKIEIAQLCGLEVEQVSRIIKAAWKLGWVSRIETKINNNNAWGQGKYPALRTSYKIKRTDTWSGLMPLYRETLEKEKSQKEPEENTRNLEKK